MLRVREWQTVTVALPPGPSCSSRAAIGRPTMLDRPTITAFAPVVSTPLRSSSCCTPYGVAGRNPDGITARDLAHVHGMKAVHVLARIDAQQHATRVDVLGQRQLHQNAVDLRIGVQTVDQREQVRLGHLCRLGEGLVIQPGLVAGLALHPHVGRRRGILAHEHRGESRRDALRLERRDVRGQLRRASSGRSPFRRSASR